SDRDARGKPSLRRAGRSRRSRDPHRTLARGRCRAVAVARARRGLATISKSPDRRRWIDLSPRRRDEAPRFTLMFVFRQACCLVVFALFAAAPAIAQTPQPPASGSGQTQTSESAVVINQKHYIRQGNVELHDPQQKTDLYADLVEFF